MINKNNLENMVCVNMSYPELYIDVIIAPKQISKYVWIQEQNQIQILARPCNSEFPYHKDLVKNLSNPLAHSIEEYMRESKGSIDLKGDKIRGGEMTLLKTPLQTRIYLEDSSADFGKAEHEKVAKLLSSYVPKDCYIFGEND